MKYNLTIESELRGDLQLLLSTLRDKEDKLRYKGYDKTSSILRVFADQIEDQID